MSRYAVLALAIVCGACFEKGLADSDPPGLRLTATTDSTPADSATLVRLVAYVPADATPARRTVTFTTNLGTFVDGGLATAQIFAIDSVATTFLRAPRIPGTARVRAQLGDVVEEASVRFDTAQPQFAVVQPSAFTVAAGSANAVPVTAYLKRNVGLVTPGFPVRFEAVRADSSLSIGTLLASTPSDAAGSVSTRFTAGDSKYRGDVHIRVFTLGGRLLGQATVTVTDPPKTTGSS